MSGFRLEGELFPEQEPQAVLGQKLCIIFTELLPGLSEETCSRLHQFRRSVSSWRFGGLPSCRLCPPEVIFLSGCPLQRTNLPYPLECPGIPSPGLLASGERAPHIPSEQ